jgi:hypothetical protein
MPRPYIFYGFTSQMRWLLSVTQTHASTSGAIPTRLTHIIFMYIFTLSLSLNFGLFADLHRLWNSQATALWNEEVARARLLSSRKMVLSSNNNMPLVFHWKGYRLCMNMLLIILSAEKGYAMACESSVYYANQTLVSSNNEISCDTLNCGWKYSVLWCSPSLSFISHILKLL